MEDDLRWKTTFGGRRLLVEDNPCMLPSPLCGIFNITSQIINLTLNTDSYLPDGNWQINQLSFQLSGLNPMNNILLVTNTQISFL